MCELLAVSSRWPVDVTLSFETFAKRGGETGHHIDGWGVAFYDGPDARLIREIDAAAHSNHAKFIESQALNSSTVVAHIRKATQGEISLRNTQPFTRTLGRQRHVFAHNGDLKGIESQPWAGRTRFRPLGTTDSERAFCILMSELVGLWERFEAIPPLEDRLEVVATFAHRIATLGPANFVYSDGQALFAHGHRRTQSDGSISSPGLHLLRRSCEQPHTEVHEGVRIQSTTAHQEVVLLASVPLSDEAWQPLGEGEVVAIAKGRVLANRLPPHPEPSYEPPQRAVSDDEDAWALSH